MNLSRSLSLGLNSPLVAGAGTAAGAQNAGRGGGHLRPRTWTAELSLLAPLGGSRPATRAGNSPSSKLPLLLEFLWFHRVHS